jgi:hypothetical protein
VFPSPCGERYYETCFECSSGFTTRQVSIPLRGKVLRDTINLTVSDLIQKFPSPCGERYYETAPKPSLTQYGFQAANRRNRSVVGNNSNKIGKLRAAKCCWIWHRRSLTRLCGFQGSTGVASIVIITFDFNSLNIALDRSELSTALTNLIDFLKFTCYF